MREFNVGDRVVIRGDWADSTEIFDGCLGTVLKVNYDDCLVKIDKAPIRYSDWLIWKENLTHA